MCGNNRFAKKEGMFTFVGKEKSVYGIIPPGITTLVLFFEMLKSCIRSMVEYGLWVNFQLFIHYHLFPGLRGYQIRLSVALQLGNWLRAFQFLFFDPLLWHSQIPFD